MPNKLIIDRLDRITLVRKGKATAKHPELREGVVEVVKAEDMDWYERFAYFIQQTDDSDIPSDWVEAFSAQQETEEGEEDEGQVTNANATALAKAGVIALAKAKSHAGAKPGQNYSSSKGPFAGPHNSFPIQSQQDVYNAARLVGHAANPAAVKARIMSIARSKGFSLPKSWSKGTSVKKSKFIDMLRALVSSVEADDEEEEVREESNPSGEPVEKASNHSHEHAHQSMRGYGYSHSHAHGHKGGVMPNSSDHDTSEVAHAHEHVAKANDPEVAGILAENEGLAKDLEKSKAEVKKAQDAESAAKSEVESLKERITALEKELAESKAEQVAVEKAKADAEALLKAQSREPKTEAPVQKSQATPVDVKNMNFDDAFLATMHG